MKFKLIVKFIRNNHPLQLIREYYQRKEFYKTPAVKSFNLENYGEIEFYTIAFNNSKFIEYQIKSLRKFCKDKYYQIIIDNSNNIEISKEIEKLSKEYNVGYIKLPPNPLFSSRSHGSSLNYFFSNFFNDRKNQYFGLLDHDIFAIKDFSFREYLNKQKMYGILFDKTSYMFSGKAWMLRPGFAFYKKDIIKNWNFYIAKGVFPPYALDTGGGNYKLLYKKIDKSKLLFASTTSKKIGDFYYDIIDREKFIHIGNGANSAGFDKKRHNACIQNLISYMDSIL